MNKSFFNLIQEVQKTGKCHHCGGCVTFCSTINQGALKMDNDGRPCFDDIEKCIECGLCYDICPETSELNKEIQENAAWEAPFGRVIGLSISRAKDKTILEKGTDGGVVTAILLHLFDTGRINGAIVSKNTEHGRIPFLATTREDLIASAGSSFSNSPGMARLTEEYNTFSASIEALGQFKGLPGRLAFVGTPCQINTMRKMQAMNLVPSDIISYCFGLFCSGNFQFHTKEFREIETAYGFDYHDVAKINIKKDFIFALSSGQEIHVPVNQLDNIKLDACHFCKDFGAEYADISFGGLGAAQGWTTAITRTSLGKELMASVMGSQLESLPYKEGEKPITRAEEQIRQACNRKVEQADKYVLSQQTDQIRIVS